MRCFTGNGESLIFLIAAQFWLSGALFMSGVAELILRESAVAKFRFMYSAGLLAIAIAELYAYKASILRP